MNDAASSDWTIRQRKTKRKQITNTKAPEGAVQRYSDDELAEFKEIIQRKLEAAKKEASYLQGLIKGTDPHAGEHEKRHEETNHEEREKLGQMYNRQVVYIDGLEKALVSVANKTYGICRVTGELIDKARLRAVPHTTQSIEAKMSEGNRRHY